MSNSSEKQEKQIHSYHTFIFPFLWNDSGRVKVETFLHCLHPLWTPDYLDDHQGFDSGRYSQFQYFNRAARNAIFTQRSDKAPVVRNYRFDLGRMPQVNRPGWPNETKGPDNRMMFTIEKKAFRADLQVNAIRLKLFSSGVGMLVFELENYEELSERDISLVNEFGRRIFMPFVSDGDKCHLCADKLALRYGDKELVSDQISGIRPAHHMDTRLPQIISFFFSNNSWKITGNATPRQKKTLYIEPIIDDRMFVACFWLNKAFTAEMAQWEDGTYRYLRDADVYAPYHEDNRARRLYELMFVDGDGLSCHSRTMLKDMLEKHIYHRWLEYAWEQNGTEIQSGTITGITEYSLVTVASYEGLAAPFLSMYIEMAMLVLAQRASLLAFERQISDCARGKGRVQKIQREYVMFQSKLLLREVTPQQQGIELYDMMLENSFINKEQHDIESQINALFSMENDLNEKYDNILLAILAAMGTFEATDILFSPSHTLSLPIGGTLFLLVLGIFILIRCHRPK